MALQDAVTSKMPVPRAASVLQAHPADFVLNSVADITALPRVGEARLRPCKVCVRFPWYHFQV